VLPYTALNVFHRYQLWHTYRVPAAVIAVAVQMHTKEVDTTMKGFGLVIINIEVSNARFISG